MFELVFDCMEMMQFTDKFGIEAFAYTYTNATKTRIE